MSQFNKLSLIKNLFLQFNKIKLIYKIILLIIFLFVISFVFYFKYYVEPMSEIYATFYVLQLLNGVDSLIQIKLNSKVALGCNLNPDDVNAVLCKSLDCSKFENLFKSMIEPGSGKYAVGYDPSTNQSVVKVCVDEKMADEMVSDLPILFKSLAKKKLVTKCTCTQISNDLREALEFFREFKKKIKEFYFD